MTVARQDDARPLLPWVVAPSSAELRPLVQRCRGTRQGREGSLRWWRGEVGPGEVLLAATGEGSRAVERGVSELSRQFRPRVLFLIGVAGGLSPSLEPGSLVASCEVGDQRGLWTIPDSRWQRAVLAEPGVAVGVIVSAPRVLSRAAEKADYWSRFGSQAGAVVDLESAAVAAWARHNSVPVVLLRAISDGAEEDLPLDFNRMAAPDGRIRRDKVLLAALSRPRALPKLWMLRGRVRDCAQKLSDVVYEVLLRT